MFEAEERQWWYAGMRAISFALLQAFPPTGPDGEAPRILDAGSGTGNNLVHLVPALWLLHYGLIIFSFSYFTGWEHRAQSFVFLALGATALLGPGCLALPLLAAGFGLVHLGSAMLRAKGNPSP